MDNTQIAGTINEQRCLLKCVESGITVSKPLFNNARYDFIIDISNRLYRIQSKASRWKDETHTAFKFNGYSQHCNGSGNKRIKYTKKDIDYFMTEKDNIFYLYPAQEKSFAEKTLRIKKNIYVDRNTNYAEDYVFEKIIQSLITETQQ